MGKCLRSDKYVLLDQGYKKRIFYGHRFIAREHLMYFDVVTKIKPANIRELIRREGIMPWSISHIGFSENVTMELIYY